MERKIQFSEGEFYHIYNRGVDRRTIFPAPKDYQRFLRMLYLCNSSESVVYRLVQGRPLDEIKRGKQLVAIGAYCLMPNHFHLLLTPLVENGISKFMLKLQTGYSYYFNMKYKRKGALVEQKFKAEHANTDEYLKYLYAYIHLNPAKLLHPKWKESKTADFTKRTWDHVCSYPYSSMREYISNIVQTIAPNYFPSYFTSAHEHTEELLFWLNQPERP